MTSRSRYQELHAPVRFKNRADLAAALFSGRFVGQPVLLTVLHDAECTPGCCSCDLEFVLEPLTLETYLAGERAQMEWMRTVCS